MADFLLPLALIAPPGTPDLVAADRTEERPIEKNNGMLAESRSLARSSAFAKSFSDGRFFFNIHFWVVVEGWTIRVKG